MDETRTSVKDSKKVEHALRRYLELFNSNCDFFKYCIAPNGVLEWFGRTVKGNNKVHDFLRFEVCRQYDHLFFETAKVCESFECKSAHMETKQIPTETVVTLNASSTDSSFGCDETACDVRTPSSTFVTAKDRRGSITPPSSAKRFKHDDEHDFNRNLPPLLNIEDYFDRKDTTIATLATTCFVTPDATPIEIGTNLPATYSELQYFETSGVLRSCTQPEHRSFRSSSSSNANGTWDRETNIKISYRIRLQDNDIQFALIIYQNIHPYSRLSKRNLMMEFDKVASREKMAANQNKVTSPMPSATQVKRKIGRRLRLF